MGDMMKLHWSPRSPFVRKVMIVLDEAGLTDRVELTRSVVAIHLPPNPEMLADNPLGKIPTLITADGLALCDSRVICEYLDAEAGTGLFPSDIRDRMDQLRWQALGDGLTDILLLWRTELTRETGPWQAVTEGWSSKVRAIMATLEYEAPALGDVPFGIGQIAIICALGQLDFRWSDCDWRHHFPALAAWAQVTNNRPSIAAHPVVDDQETGVDVTAGQLIF